MAGLCLNQSMAQAGALSNHGVSFVVRCAVVGFLLWAYVLIISKNKNPIVLNELMIIRPIFFRHPT
jgi:hypothetical protein